MAKQGFIEQLDQAVQEILVHPDARPSVADEQLSSLLRIAVGLRHLPRPDFKASLKTELQRRASMTNVSEPVVEGQRPTVDPIPRGYHTLTPYIIAQDAPALIGFVKQAFAAEETFRTIGSAGGIHAELQIADSKLMIGGGSPELSWRGDALPTSLHIYVPDADAVYQRALEAGAISVEQPTDQPYGDREAGVKDLAGNFWWIATHKEGGYIPQGLRTVTPFLHPLRGEPVINFLKSAFGAEEQSRAQSPDGAIHHALIRVGDSALEMGEAHGPYQPMPTMFYVYVPDVDAVYQRALQAGATSIAKPADQSYGDRTAAVKDAFGNQWYIATHIKDV